MANPAGHVVMGEEEVQQAAERYAAMEAELQALRQRNDELMHAVQEQQDLVAAERVRADRSRKSSDAGIRESNRGALGGTKRAGSTVGGDANWGKG